MKFNKQNLEWTEAFEALKNGEPIKRPHWEGYWKWEDDTIKMYCKEGTIIDIRDTQDVLFTFENIAAKDWAVLETVLSSYQSDTHTQKLSFSGAIRSLKQGKKVARTGWNGKGMYVYMVQGTSVPKENLRNEAKAHVGNSLESGESVNICPHIDMKAADGSIVVGWLASQTDLLSDDWCVLS